MQFGDRMIDEIPLLAAGTAVIGLAIAALLYSQIEKIKIENSTVADITQQIREGAMAFLFAEYRYLAIFIVIVAGLLFVNPDTSIETVGAFLAGAAASVIAGFIGMRAATSANGRTAMAASDGGQASALEVSYNGGAVMGLSVGGLGLLGISIMSIWLGTGDKVQNIAGFGMGASSIALFARVGGGIYTKAADVGADLVGKVEAGIPEDDPRNPGVIADNVGDNVGDVAGMGADIFESFVGSIIAAMVIAQASNDMSSHYIVLPIFLGLVGYGASIIGVFSMNLLKSGDPAAALRNTTFIAAGLFWLVGWLGIDLLGLDTGTEPMIAVVIGSLVGILIGLVTEYYTSGDFSPVKKIAEAGKTGAVTIATNMAGRGTDIKLGGNKDFIEAGVEKNIDEYKKNELKVKNLGGLFIIGTERHESRRIDNQLRGRSGRQGDIGESIFFLSLEDDLMRIFGSKTLESILSKIGLKDGEVITHSMITKSLERAQQKVESHNYDLRKQILKFDDILNDQRKIIYQNRKEILKTNDQSKIIDEMISETIDEIVLECIPPKKYSNEWNSELLNKKINDIFNLDLPIKSWFEEEGVDEIEIKKRLNDQIYQKYEQKRHKYSSELLRFAEKRVMLYQIDKDWRDHLAAMDSLRGSVNLRAMGGKDPFYEYKRESFDYFDQMLSNQNERVLTTLFNIELVSNNKNNEGNGESTSSRRIISKKIGRNEKCPCGSGKKYKQCHGA